ncbi:MAG TPA: hypothetical protein P5555_07430 [Candidatus Paceibacterota bacterium]|nr:hypothetical protein [Verrucomicrobiota bacterium]HRZ45008.1 hypothetical protein [Candidatus Paceibacterota bacterium]
MADCKVDGTVKAGSQQQWLSRSSEWKEWQVAETWEKLGPAPEIDYDEV